METNDNRNNNGQPYTYQYGSDQPGGYYYNPYNPYGGAPGGKPPERKGLRRALIAIFMVLCLIIGSAIGVYVLSPDFGAGRESEVAAAEPTATPATQTSEKPNATPDSALTTNDPQIGGDTPSISGGDSPIVQIVAAISPSVVVVRIDDPSVPDDYDAQGTGFIITADGYIVTNNHVVAERGSYNVVVKMSDGTEYKAGVVGGDEATDVAVIKIDAKDLTAVALGDSDTLRVGEEVVAIGNALGQGYGTVTSGIVSGLHQDITNEDGYTQEYIQTDAAINPGNSGGPLIDMSGEVIGINTLKDTVAGIDEYGQTISAEGIGYAIPINTAKPVIEELMRNGSVERPGIGISCLVDEYNEYNPSGSPEGVTVVSVTEGGPAALAGIMANDIIIKADGKIVKTVEELTDIIRGHAVGEKLSLTVWRDGREHEASVTVGDLNNMS